MQVRVMLLYGSCSVSDHPEVWVWVRKASDFGFLGSNCLTIFDHKQRAARILAISIKKSLPVAQKKERRGAKLSILRPASTPVRKYSRPFAKV